MFTKETIKYIADSLGLSVKEFETKFKDEKEVKVELPEKPIKVFKTEEEFETYKKNLLAPEYGRGIDDGKKNATEVLIKGIRDTEGLELTNSHLNQKDLLSALKTKYGGDNKELIAQFEKDKTLLLKKAEDLEKDYSEKLSEQAKHLTRMKLRNESLSGIKGDTKFDKFDGIDLIMKDITVEKDAAGKEFIHYKGIQQKNEQLEPLSMSEVADNVFIEKKWYSEENGRGVGNKGGDGVTNKYKDFLTEMEDKNIHQGSAQYQDELSKRMEDKDFQRSVEEAE